MFHPVRKLRAELRSAKRTAAGVRAMREFSFLTWSFERIFFWLEFLSPSIFFIPTRSLIHTDVHSLSEGEKRETYIVERMRHRARHVDTYILSCVAVELLLALTVREFDTLALRIVISILMVIRILDIGQANVNLNVFDPLRYGERSHVTISIARNLIVAAITYCELILCFGLLYATMPYNLVGSHSWHESFYFSMVTQLTVGYGDIRPVGIARLIATIQGLVGLFFSLLIMGRFVSLLPAVRTVDAAELRESVRETTPRESSERPVELSN